MTKTRRWLDRLAAEARLLWKRGARRRGSPSLIGGRQVAAPPARAS